MEEVDGTRNDVETSERPGQTDEAEQRSPAEHVIPYDVRKEMSDEERHKLLIRWSDPKIMPNIAAELEEQELSEIGINAVRETEIDDVSRSDWLERNEKALELAMQKPPERKTPWPGASNVLYPLIPEAALQFGARAYPAIVSDRNVVKGTVYGSDKGVIAKHPQTGQPMQKPDGSPLFMPGMEPGDKRRRADRIAEHMSWQKLQQQPNWEKDTDKLVHMLPNEGAVFRKTWYASMLGRNASSLVSAKNFIVNYWARSIEDAPRQTEVFQLYPHEIESNKRTGYFLDQEFGHPIDGAQDPEAPHDFLEQHRRLDLDCDGYAEPYIVTVHKETNLVARIVARFDPGGVKTDNSGRIVIIEAVQYYTAYEFFPNPEGGVYGVGFGQLLVMLAKQINSTLNQMFDAGHLQISGGGFIGKGPTMHAGAVKFRPGEYKLINALGSTVRDSVVPINFPGPSEVMFKLMGMLVEAGRDIAAIKDILTGDKVAANTPATTIMAMIEQGLKVFSAIFKRIHRSLQAEYDKDFRLNRIYMEESAEFTIANQVRVIERKDYQMGAGIEPVSDPKTVSDMQKLGRAEFLRTFQNDPHFDAIALRRRLLLAANVENPDELLMEQPPPNPKLLLETAKLQLDMIAVRAKAMNEMAQAVEHLAKAESTGGAEARAWIEHEIDTLRKRLETFDEGGQNGGAGQPGAGAGGPGAAGANGGGGPGPLPSLAPPPGNQAGSPLPQ